MVKTVPYQREKSFSFSRGCQTTRKLKSNLVAFLKGEFLGEDLGNVGKSMPRVS